jgi:hypothetical protein
MKALILSAVLLVLSVTPAFAATIYDEDLTETTTATYSASTSAIVRPTPTPTPRSRTTTTSTAKTPVSGAVENTIALTVIGSLCLLIGIRFSRE